LLLQQKKTAEAKNQFDAALKKTKEKDAEVLEAIAKAHFEASSGDANYAAELLEKAIKRDKRNPELYVLIGDVYRKLMNGSESYKAYERALSINPDNPAANYKLGKIFLTQNNQEMYLKYFHKAVQLDSMYTPALYELYYHYYFRDVNQAMKYLDKYIAASDYDIKNELMVTDLLFASRKYPDAIKSAAELIQKLGPDAEPRLYKLIAYSYKETNDAENALAYMNTYFNKEEDSNYVVKDFEAMAEMFSTIPGKEDSAALYYNKALSVATSDSIKVDYYKTLAELYKNNKNYTEQAKWLEKYYQASPNTSNVDLFNWGVANYMAGNYQQADSVFATYEEKYPEQNFGTYWRARSNIAMDTAMEKGLAVPHYLKLIEICQQDTTNEVNRKRLLEAFGYLAAYEANIQKDFPEAIAYFQKILALEPENKSAKTYMEILQKNLEGNAKK